MINLQTEQLIPIADVAKSDLIKPGGVNMATLYRWRLKGLNGVKLQTVRVGRRRYTTTGAIRRFIAAVNQADGERVTAGTDAVAELDRMGV